MGVGVVMKFREHRGGLRESLATTVEIEPTAEALVAAINTRHPGWKLTTDNISVGPYGGIDPRCGWDTHIVVISGIKGLEGAHGFTDGALRS